MIKLERAQVMNLENALRGMRNPLDSWEKSDSGYQLTEDGSRYVIGPDDLKLARRLVKAGSDHRKFLRQIFVSVDITAPLYWWKEFDTYKVGTVANSCSTMHKIHAKEFTLDDFSHEHLFDDDTLQTNTDVLQFVIDALNFARAGYIKTKDKKYWWQMIQLLPTSYNQRRTILLNYEVLAAIYRDRRKHKLDEWHVVCDWIELLPHSEIITR